MEIAIPLKVRQSDVKEYTLQNNPRLSCCWSLEKPASFSFTQ